MVTKEIRQFMLCCVTLSAAIVYIIFNQQRVNWVTILQLQVYLYVVFHKEAVAWINFVYYHLITTPPSA